MTIALISPLESRHKAVESALLLMDMVLKPYVSVDLMMADIAKGTAIEMCFIDIESELDLKAVKNRDKMPVFAFLGNEIDKNSLKSYDFQGVYTKPVRLGRILKDIQDYRRQKQQKMALKPINFGQYALDPRKNSFSKGKKNITTRLTDKEMDILIYLHSCHPAKVQRQDLLDHVWDYAQGVETHTLETHIYRLRQKIEQDPSQPDILMTDEDGYFLKF